MKQSFLNQCTACLLIPFIANASSTEYQAAQLDSIFDAKAAVSGTPVAPLRLGINPSLPGPLHVPAASAVPLKSGTSMRQSNHWTWLGNLTWGLCNSILGLTASLLFCIPPLLFGKLPKIGLSPTGEQILVQTPVAFIPFSLGIFHIGQNDSKAKHETAHSRQSAALGPLFLPLIAVDYLILCPLLSLIIGEPTSIMENCADKWN